MDSRALSVGRGHVPILVALACIAVVCWTVEWTLRRPPQPRRLRLSEPIQDRDPGDETPPKGPKVECPRDRLHDAMMDPESWVICWTCDQQWGEGYFRPATAGFPTDKAA